MWGKMDTAKSDPEEDETCEDIVWRIIFDYMSHFNWLAGVRRTQLYHNTTEVIHAMDGNSRKIFPTVFALINIIYWTAYIYLF